MAIGVNSLLYMGNGALFASQASIQTTGNNISNVNTVGYSRQSVDLRPNYSIDYRPGQVGQGVEATQIIRSFDRFVESAYLEKSTLQSRYNEQYSMMRTVETAFNESNTKGIADAISQMFKAWSTVAQTPDSLAARTALTGKSQDLTTIVRNTDNYLGQLEEQLTGMISQEVDKANSLIQDIARLNREINAHAVPGQNNPNSLMDERDRKVRSLAEIIDIRVQDDGAGHFQVTTSAGMRLVQEDIPFSLTMMSPRSENNLSIGSTYNGGVGFTGKDGYEYTLEVVQGGTIDSTGSVPAPVGTAKYRVSLDGGRTWMKDDYGNDLLVDATDEAHSSKVKDLQIYFTGTNSLQTGDKFVITPKTDVYWVSPTAGPVNISTQIFQDGQENSSRITGGTLAAYQEFRDHRIGQYRDTLASLGNSMTWEVNRIHSQGAGLKPLTNALGEFQVPRVDIPLGSRSSGSQWFDRLQSGNVTFAVYDSTTGESLTPYPGIQAFSPDNFDPTQHSLQDVVSAINAGPAGAYMTASIVDNRLQLTANAGTQFGITADTAGLAAALGINAYFVGNGPSDMRVRDELVKDPGMINAARVNGAGEINPGDNQIATEIAGLLTKMVEFTNGSGSKVKQTFSEFYGTLVTKVGADTAGVGFLANTTNAMAKELAQRREEISGVSLDEEMSNLIKFQASYKAAAKLITTADQMIQTILGLKQ